MNIKSLLFVVVALAVGIAVGFYYRGIDHELKAKQARRVCGTVYTVHTLSSPGDLKKLSAFDPAKSDSSITISYPGRSSWLRRLSGKSELYVNGDANLQYVRTVANELCRSMFALVLTNGILDYDEGVLAVKKDLLQRRALTELTDEFPICIEIIIPQFHINKQISFLPSDLENYPEIPEYRLAVEAQNQLRSLFQ